MYINFDAMKYIFGPFDRLKYHHALASLHKEYGPIVKEDLGGREIIHLFDPEDIKTVSISVATCRGISSVDDDIIDSPNNYIYRRFTQKRGKAQKFHHCKKQLRFIESKNKCHLELVTQMERNGIG